MIISDIFLLFFQSIPISEDFKYFRNFIYDNDLNYLEEKFSTW